MFPIQVRWNDNTQAHHGVEVDIDNAATADNSSLIRIAINGVVKFMVDLTGAITTGGSSVNGVALATSGLVFQAGDYCVYVAAGAPVDYTDGTPPATGEGVAGIGSEYVNTTTGKHYFNGGTKAEPLWKIVTSA